MCSCGMDIFASEYRRILQFLKTIIEFRIHIGRGIPIQSLQEEMWAIERVERPICMQT